MKPHIHPEYFEDATIVCACGATYKTGSTKKTASVELCAECHPFYTGTQTIIDTARRVEKFKERLAMKDTIGKGKVGKTAKKARRVEKRKEAGPNVDVEETRTGRIVKQKMKVMKKAEKAEKEKKEVKKPAAKKITAKKAAEKKKAEK